MYVGLLPIVLCSYPFWDVGFRMDFVLYVVEDGHTQIYESRFSIEGLHHHPKQNRKNGGRGGGSACPRET